VHAAPNDAQAGAAATTGEDHDATFESAFARGERLRGEWREDAARAAVKEYERARAEARAAGDVRAEAAALSRTGDIHYTLSEYARALDAYKEALALERAAKDTSGEAKTLNDIGYVYIYLGETPKAGDFCQRARRLGRSVGDRRVEAQALNNLGEVYYFSSEIPKALDYFTRALALWQETGDTRGQAQALNNLGDAHYDLREMPKALEFYERALALWKQNGDRQGEALSLTALGGAHSYLGDKQRALVLHKDSVELFRRMGDRSGEAVALNGLGYVYDHLGQHQHAVDCYDRAVKLFHAVGNRDYESIALVLLGRAYQSLEKASEALECYRQVLSFNPALNYRLAKAYALNSSGMVYSSLGDKQRARDFYNQALPLYRTLEDKMGEASTLNNLGSIYDSLDDKQRARVSFDAALALSRQVEDRTGEASALYNIARVERDVGNLREARAQIEDAIELIERQRAGVSSEGLRASYFASVHQHYELYIDVLMRMHDERPSEGLNVAALDASERARARSLLELLSEARARIRRNIDPKLLERERELRGALAARAERQMKLLSGKHTDEEAAALAQEIRNLTAQYDLLEAQSRERSPRYAALTRPVPLSLAEIRRQVLDERTLMLEYSLGDERSYLWAVTRDSVESYELPRRAEIERAARRLYELLLAHQPVAGESLPERQARQSRASADYWPQAAALGQMLLGPLAARLENKRLLIVADGALQYVPFHALTVPETNAQQETNARQETNTQQQETNAPPQASAQDDGTAARGDKVESEPLMLRHEIVYLPSASALAALRQETARRPPAPKAVAVVADPVFEYEDARLVAARAKQTKNARERESQTPELQTVSGERDAPAGEDDLRLARLFASQDEAEAIMSFAPAGASLRAVGFDASRARATDPSLADYRIVHFATHGIIDSLHPELSGLVLSRFDERGQAQDGFLRLPDIYSLNLSADLVVLSACNTGLGKEIRGEGLVGLTRGFMYAGAPRVMASLWKVDDEATAALMKQFYRRMLGEGMTPAAALREAQIAMWRQKRWRSPYYWAAFVLQGEYEGAINIPGETPRFAGRQAAMGSAVALTLTLLGGSIYTVRRKKRRRTTRAAL
jgi:CHAT domain-containing protein/tetratricopeptide (TPR) repeat protein